MRWIKPNVKGRKPCPRYFHSITMIGDAVIVIGGKDDHMRFNDVHVFNKDPKCAQWTQPHIRGTPPKQRSAHTVNVVGNKVYVFGGHRDGEKFNDVQVLDTGCMTWMVPKVKGYPPGKRNAHTATACGQMIYVFGGFDGESCNDLFTLDTETLTWTSPECTGSPPSRRCCHSATLVDQCIWIFAGKNNDSEGVIDRFNDLHCLDTRSRPHRWLDVAGKVSGTPPSKRNAHSAVAVGRSLLVFGGFDGESCNDLFWFDTHTFVWQEITCSSTSPAARYCHASACFTLTPEKASDRGGHCVLVFGGCDADKNYSDVQLLEIAADEIPGAPKEVEEAKPDPQVQEKVDSLQVENARLAEQVEQQTTLIKMLREGKDALEEQLRHAKEASASTDQQHLRPQAAGDGSGRRRRGRRKRGTDSGLGAASPDDDDDDYASDNPSAGGASESVPAEAGKGRADATDDVDSDEDDDDGAGRKRRREKRKKRKEKKTKGKSAPALDDDDGEEPGISDSRSGGSGAVSQPRPPARGGSKQSPKKGTGGMNQLNMAGVTRGDSGGAGVPNTCPGRLPALGGASAADGSSNELFPPLKTNARSMLDGQ